MSSDDVGRRRDLFGLAVRLPAGGARNDEARGVEIVLHHQIDRAVLVSLDGDRTLADAGSTMYEITCPSTSRWKRNWSDARLAPAIGPARGRWCLSFGLNLPMPLPYCTFLSAVSQEIVGLLLRGECRRLTSEGDHGW
jgi:hypothetical protein